MGRTVDGILGSDFMKYVVKSIIRSVCYGCMTRKSLSTPAQERVSPALERFRHAVIPAEFTVAGRAAVKGNFVVDIGSAGSLVLHSPIVEAEHLPPTGQKTISVLGAMGAGGKVTGRTGRIAALTIGKYRIDDPITLFSNDKAGAFSSSEQQGNIGQRILSKFEIYLDYAHSRLILEPNATFKAEIGQAASGLAVIAEGADYKTFRIVDLLEDSPATEVGLRKDDIIVAADAIPASELTLSMLHEMFEQPTPHKLSVRRGAETLQIILTPRKLI